MAANIPLFKIYWDDEDVERVTAVIKRGSYWAVGPEIKEFEQKTAEYIGVKHALALNSGGSALHTVLAAHGVGGKDEIIVPSFTFIATADAPLYAGARSVFADIEDKTYGLDPEDVQRRITPRTKAIMPIHYGGLSCQIEKLRQIAQEHNLLLIEDAAESLGATVNGKMVGSFGDSAILSLCAPKVITTGEGGMIFTNSQDVYEHARLLYSYGRADTANYFSSTERMQYVSLGYNFRMSTMTAALGIAQMNKLDKVIAMRRENAAYLTRQLSHISDIKTPKEPDGYFCVYQMYTIRLKEANKRDGLKDYLNKNGIGAKVYFDPIHLSLFYRRDFGYKEGDLPVTERISKEVLTLPMYPGLTEGEMNYVTQKIEDFFSGR